MMKRRTFVKNSMLTTLSAAALPLTNNVSGTSAKITREIYELRIYTLKNEQQQNLVEEYFKYAAIPALNRLGSKNVGVFTELKPSGQTKLFVLISYSSVADFLAVNQQLAGDQAYQEAGNSYLAAPAGDPAYERIESSLLQAFVHAPTLRASPGKSRIFELRRYEHATESAGKKKLEMFNDAGEVNIFKRLGFKPVFFGETLIGDARPNLIYMVTFDNMDAHDSHWKAFGSDPEWEKISSIPDYADAKLVSRISSTFLSPAEYSQI